MFLLLFCFLYPIYGSFGFRNLGLIFRYENSKLEVRVSVCLRGNCVGEEEREVGRELDSKVRGRLGTGGRNRERLADSGPRLRLKMAGLSLSEGSQIPICWLVFAMIIPLPSLKGRLI